MKTPMKQTSIRRMWVAMIVLAGGWMGVSEATACDRPYAPPDYRTVMAWESQVEAYPVWVTKYDHCGRAYRAEVTRYRTVSVPVTRRVRVS